MFTYKALNLVDHFRRAASCIFICSSIMDEAPILPLLSELEIHRDCNNNPTDVHLFPY